MDAGNTTDNESLGRLISWYFREESGRGESGGRHPCPDEQTLCQYLAGGLPDEACREVERHIARCTVCCQTLVAAVDLQSDPWQPDEADVPEGVLRAALGLIPGAVSPRPAGRQWRRLKSRAIGLWREIAELFMLRQPEFVYVRGSKKVISKNLVVIEKVFKTVKLDIEIEKIRELSSNIKVCASDPASSRLLPGVRISLFDDGRELASFMTDGGETLFEHIAFGEYSLAAWKQADKLGEVRITIKE